MEQNSGESRSGEAMSIFGQSIDARRPPRSRRRATQKKFSPAAESPATPSVERQHQRRAVAERERARAESELSRASSMANELEQQIEQANARTRSHRPELHGTRAGGSRRRKSPVGVGVGADQAQDQSNSLYVEVMHELDLVKRELRQLQHEVKAAREAQTPTPTRVSTSGSRRLDGVTREAGGGGNEGRRGIAELSKQPGGYREATRRARGESLQGDTSRGSDADERFATASSSDVGIESADTKAMVPTTAATRGHAVENGESALAVITPRREEEEAAEAELLTSARTELASIKEEGARLTSSMERTRREAARVAEEIARLAEQEERAGAQVRQLNARLHRARSRLGAATAADEAAEAALAELRAALRRLGEEAEAAEKGREMAEHERRHVMEDAEGVAAEAAAAERRVRESVGELEAARAAEAAAAEELRAIAVGAATRKRAAQRSGNNVTIPRFEYEYLAGRGEVVRAVAEKKVAAAEAWVEALRAGEKEVVMRTEVIETEIREMAASGEAVDADDDPRDDEEREPRVGGLQRAQTRRRPAPPKENEVLPATLRRTGTVVARKPRPLSFVLQGKKRRASVPKCMKCFGGRC
ncbi:unnamed protein product [Urochloa decumbens]|uniref:Uncharacterized protein n=1 Tax=Urochloa decumbens TaxID=240449 RepID=A0ABC9GLC9_9POAL